VREIKEEVRAKDDMAEEANVDTVLGVPLQEAGKRRREEVTSMLCEIE
jgi:hypothetical protein